MEKRICKFCEKEFLADKREIKRGNAIFCSLRCFAFHKNTTSFKYNVRCIICGSLFQSISSKAKYCSSKCKSKHYRLSLRTNEGLTNKYQKILLSLPCEVCGWNQGPRDVHHILPVNKGGKNELYNLITLCPNCHRLSHRNLLSDDKLIKLVEIRTISSSSIKEETDAKSGN
jgi:5-methylcytosine-specific restriction endonuclease McrA